MTRDEGILFSISNHAGTLLQHCLLRFWLPLGGAKGHTVTMGAVRLAYRMQVRACKGGLQAAYHCIDDDGERDEPAKQQVASKVSLASAGMPASHIVTGKLATASALQNPMPEMRSECSKTGALTGSMRRWTCQWPR